MASNDTDDSDYEPDERASGRESTDTPARPTRRRSIRTKGKRVDYDAEKVDMQFSGAKGYTHFGRVRKGGDFRPNAVKAVGPSKAGKSAVTVLNFFAPVGKKPLPKSRKPQSVKKQKSQTILPPTTRTKWGRPTKRVSEDDKVQRMKARVANCKTAHGLAVPPQKRKKWNGTV